MAETLFGGPVRPAYRRPLMKEMTAVPRHGGVAVSTFAGCGGSTLGLMAAGWAVPIAVEFLPLAAETYRANFPGRRVIQTDIRAVTAEQIQELAGEPIDLLEGGPPCAGFSSSGIRSRGWGKERRYSSGPNQRVDDLFDEWFRLVEGLRPRAVLAENVAGMMEGRALEEHVHALMRGLSEAGYSAHAMVLDAADYGVPQNRRRLIIVGYRRDVVDGYPTFPVATLEQYTLREALDTVDPIDPNHFCFVDESSMKPFAVGRAWEAMKGLRPWGPVDPEDPEGLPVRQYYSMFLGDWDRPCRTITAKAGDPSTASVVHPDECRKFTPAELLAIQGFPPDFRLVGTLKQRTERIGRAVPPPLYRAIGGAIARDLGLVTT